MLHAPPTLAEQPTAVQPFAIQPFVLQHNAQPATDQQRAAILSDPGFGRYYTDHMVSLL